MKKPDVEAILRPLKPFQRRTVEHAFEQPFLTADSSARFLVADEVGLGKTLVARGVIAKAIDYYWDSVNRIDIVYICSNQAIAHSNLPKLQMTAEGERSFALATRLTMLASELDGEPGQPSLADSKLNFVSFTPGTSFNMGNSGGQAKERRVLFHLLDGLVEPRTGLMNLLQAGVKHKDQWRYKLNHHPFPLDTWQSGRNLWDVLFDLADADARNKRSHPVLDCSRQLQGRAPRTVTPIHPRGGRIPSAQAPARRLPRGLRSTASGGTARPARPRRHRHG